MPLFTTITASHYVLPAQTLTHAALAERFGEKAVASIEKLSGILERRVAPEGVSALDLGEAAARRMLEEKNVDFSSIDMLVFGTITPDHPLPGNGVLLHERLGLSPRCGAFDIPQGCPTFHYVLSVANGLIASGQCRKVLVVVADAITQRIRPDDRGLITLHGDGAAAFLIERAPDSALCGVEAVEIGLDSSGWKHLTIDADGLHMNGAAVFHFGVSRIPDAVAEFLRRTGRTMAEFDTVLLHQANKMMLRQIYDRIGVPESKQFFFMERIGNLSAASTPVLLARALREGAIPDGGRALVVSFGAGLAWGLASLSFQNPRGCACTASDTL